MSLSACTCSAFCSALQIFHHSTHVNPLFSLMTPFFFLKKKNRPHTRGNPLSKPTPTSSSGKTSSRSSSPPSLPPRRCSAASRPASTGSRSSWRSSASGMTRHVSPCTECLETSHDVNSAILSAPLVGVESALWSLLLSLAICVAAVSVFTAHPLLLLPVLSTILGRPALRSRTSSHTQKCCARTKGEARIRTCVFNLELVCPWLQE